MSYVWLQKGPEIRALQEALIRKGYKLDRFGADGELAGETWKKIEAYAKVDHFPIGAPLPPALIQSILSSEPAPQRAGSDGVVGRTSTGFVHPDGYVRVVGDPSDVHGHRKWSALTAIVLHQTGVWMTDTPDRFKTLDAHIGILDAHPTPVVQVQELTAYMYHANQTNPFSVGIEINGSFPGLVKDFNPRQHTHIGPTDRQVDHARLAMKWICDEVAANGGKITHVLPHRCSNDTRRYDPGEAAWKALGLWAQDNLGLLDYGPGWKVGDGTPIPYAWTGRAGYEKYSY